MEDKPVSKRLLNETPEQGIKRIFHEHAENEFAVETVQDVTEIVAENKENYNARGGERFKFFQNHVAQIPTSVYYDLIRRGIIDEKNDPEGIRLTKWLNDPDNRVWRTRPGRL
jgi:hypothetical protein